METSASFEARSAPSSYPTGPHRPNKNPGFSPWAFFGPKFWASKFGQDTRIGFSPCYGAFCTKCSSGAQGLNMLWEKASLHEGHGFSRAIEGLRTTALAAEVRFFDTYGATSSLPRLSSPQTMGKTYLRG
jgi:hypothetical protein